MKTKLVLLALLPFLWLEGKTQNLQIDAEKSSIRFEVDNMLLNTVEGSFGGMNGEIRFDAEQIEKAYFNVCIDVGTVETGNAKRDEHLRTEDFFWLDKHPNICMEITEVKKLNENEFSATAKLSIRGIEKEINFPFERTETGFTGSFTVNRFDFDLGNDTNTFLVGEEVQITVDCILK